jgi:hypothetical protein
LEKGNPKGNNYPIPIRGARIYEFDEFEFWDRGGKNPILQLLLITHSVLVFIEKPPDFSAWVFVFLHHQRGGAMDFQVLSDFYEMDVRAMTKIIFLKTDCLMDSSLNGYLRSLKWAT